MQALRYWDYYDMIGTFTDLHEKAKKKEMFDKLYDVTTSRTNILLSHVSLTESSNNGSSKCLNPLQKLISLNIATVFDRYALRTMRWQESNIWLTTRICTTLWTWIFKTSLTM